MRIFDALDNVFGPKHATEPPIVVESLQHIGPDDKTQDMSGQTIIPAVYMQSCPKPDFKQQIPK